MNIHTEKRKENISQSVANTATQKQNNDASTFKLVDNRPEAAAQRKLQGGITESSNSTQTIQRMTAIAREDKNSVDDPLILGNAEYATKVYGGPIVDFKENRDFKSMSGGERLAIVEHGGPGDIAGKNGETVAEILTNVNDPIPKNIASVVLYSCFASKDEGGAKTSLAAKLASALSKRGYDIPVHGQVGIAFGFSGIGERTSSEDLSKAVPQWAAIRNKFLGGKYAKWSAGKNIDWSDFGVVGKVHDFKKIDEIFKAENIHPLPVSIEDKAKKISEIMTPFWRDVESEAGSELFPHLKGWISYLGYAKGKELTEVKS